MKTKQCYVCHKYFPASIYYFWKNNSAKDGLFISCKKCNAGVKKEYYLKKKQYFKDYGKKYYMDVIVKNNIHVMCYRTLYSHKRKGYIVDITLPELIEMAKSTDYCPLCNVKFDKELGHKKTCQKNSLSFDCINNKKEFIRGNIQVICYSCNAKKTKGSTKVNMGRVLRKINEFSKKALTRKERLSQDQIDVLEKCLVTFPLSL